MIVRVEINYFKKETYDDKRILLFYETVDTEDESDWSVALERRQRHGVRRQEVVQRSVHVVPMSRVSVSHRFWSSL